MTEEEIINGLQDLILDRESFITEEDSIFVQDKKVLEEAIKLIQKLQKETDEMAKFIESKELLIDKHFNILTANCIKQYFQKIER